jgi:hypothetical protein
MGEAWKNAVHSDPSVKELPNDVMQIPDEELAFYYHSDTDHGDDNIWGLLSGVGGNIYEW